MAVMPPASDPSLPFLDLAFLKDLLTRFPATTNGCIAELSPRAWEAAHKRLVAAAASTAKEPLQASGVQSCFVHCFFLNKSASLKTVLPPIYFKLILLS